MKDNSKHPHHEEAEADEVEEGHPAEVLVADLH
jgi:hypothetical protein